MEKMIVTEYSRPIMLNKVKEFVQRTMYLAENKVIPYAVFALLDSGEMVNIGNFNDADTAEIIRIILDIFAEDKKAVFDVNLEVFGIRNFLEMLRYVSADSEALYHTLVSDLKRQLKSGELDVSFTCRLHTACPCHCHCGSRKLQIHALSCQTSYQKRFCVPEKRRTGKLFSVGVVQAVVRTGRKIFHKENAGGLLF